MNDEQHQNRAEHKRITPNVHKGFTTKSKRRRDWKRQMRHYVMLGALHVLAVIAVILAISVYKQMVKAYHPFQDESLPTNTAELTDASLVSRFDVTMSQ